jgi:hypothetical protein
MISKATLSRRQRTTSNRSLMRRDEQKSIKAFAARAKAIRRNWSPDERVAREMEAQLSQIFLAAAINPDQEKRCHTSSSPKLAG